jgi:hypothetical protein
MSMNLKTIIMAFVLCFASSSVLAKQEYWTCYAQSPTWWGVSVDLKTEEAARLFAVATCASGTAVGLRCVVLTCATYYKSDLTSQEHNTKRRLSRK